MRFVCISDTHSLHKRVTIPDGDVFIHAGDFTNVGELEDIRKFNFWLGKLPHRYKIIIAGNHDIAFEKRPALARRFLTEGMYLEDSEIIIEGVRIYGSPWQPEFMEWAFNLPRGKALKEKWDLIPEGIDVLITHGPPHGILDQVNQGEHLGCEELAPAVKRIKPKYHIFGNIHDGYGQLSEDNITYINASICTEEYKPINKPIVFNL